MSCTNTLTEELKGASTQRHEGGLEDYLMAL